MTYRLFTIGIFLFALLAMRASASTTVTFDSVWWNGLSQDEQIVAVEGAIDSYQQGYTNGAIALSGTVHDYMLQHVKVSDRDSIATAMYHALDKMPKMTPIFSKTFGTYIHGISDFYSNFPDASKVTIGGIVVCLADKPERSCEQVAKAASKT